MLLTNLKDVKGYKAGRYGNLLVSLDDKLVQERVYETDKKDIAVRMLICTAYVDNPETQEELRKYTDGTVPVDRLIVVSKKFLKLSNKMQLILLAKQNAREDMVDSASCDKEVESYARIVTMSEYGIFTSSRAFRKERKITEKDEKKAGKKLYKCNKKTGKKADPVDDDFDDFDDDFDDAINEGEDLETTESGEAEHANTSKEAIDKVMEKKKDVEETKKK